LEDRSAITSFTSVTSLFQTTGIYNEHNSNICKQRSDVAEILSTIQDKYVTAEKAPTLFLSAKKNIAWVV
jgi:hypothetical protein